ncbi:MAG: phosphoglycerate dehydrogenase [Candidatus Dormibacteria bacterium]
MSVAAANIHAVEQLAIDSERPRILVADQIAADGVERLRGAGQVDVITGQSAAELVARIGDYEALVVRSETKVTAEVFAAATKLRVVGRAGVGVDNIDLDAATHHGVLVLNAPTGNTVAAAEHAVAMMLALSRNIAPADASTRAGEWKRSQYVGVELREKTLGLYGLGKIGYEVARIAGQGLQMRVLAHDPLVTPERADQAGAQLVDLATLLHESDFLSVHAPLTDKTRGVIGAPELRAMKPTARVVNVARGGIVDESALAAAVSDGTIAGAAVDVFTTEPIPAGHPLLGLPGVLLTPHLGASTAEAQVNVAFDVADQIASYLGGGPARYAVNLPAILPEELSRLSPFLGLARQMGSLVAQLAGQGLRGIVCTYTGDLAELDSTPLTAEVLGGLFAHFTETRVTPINARAVARRHGVEVDEQRRSHSEDYQTSITVEVRGARSLRVSGTQFEGEARLTRLDEFRVDMQPVGTYLIGSHHDQPGVIARVSTLLAENDVNIAAVQVGRERPRGRAVMVMQVDEPVSAPLLERMRTTAGLESLQSVTL